MEIITSVMFDAEEKHTLLRAAPDVWLASRRADISGGDMALIRRMGGENSPHPHAVLARAEEALNAAWEIARHETSADVLLESWGWKDVAPVIQPGTDFMKGVSIIAKTPREVAEDIAQIRDRQMQVLWDALIVVRNAKNLTTPTKKVLA